MNERKDIEAQMIDTIIERPITFDIDGKRYCLYPPSLGVTYLVAPITQSLGFSTENLRVNVFAEMLKVCSTHKDDVCHILALYSFRRRYDLFDAALIENRTKEFAILDVEQLASVYMLTLGWTDVEMFAKHIGLDVERVMRERITAMQKKTSKTVSFGGRSVYGSLIDYACQRYGWTMQYVVWGISYANLQMLIADALNTAYLNDDEMRKLGVQNGDCQVLDGDDPQNAALIRQLFGG